MKATIVFKAFLATGWFIKPDCIGDIEKVMERYAQNTLKPLRPDAFDIVTRCNDLSAAPLTHAAFATQIGLQSIKWESRGHYEIMTVNGVPYHLSEIENGCVIRGIIRDLDSLSMQNRDVQSIIFLEDFLNAPFFKIERKIFEALGYDIYTYSIENKTLTKLNGGDHDAQNKTADVSDVGAGYSVADHVTDCGGPDPEFCRFYGVTNDVD